MSHSKKEHKDLLVGIFDDEEILLDAVHDIRKKEMKIDDVFTPFPVHGLDEALGYQESKLHVGGFIFGLAGFVLALGGMSWIVTQNWSINIGGKPPWALPAFVPIIFELTVLFASVGMFLSYLARNKMWPGKEVEILDERTSDHKFAMTFDTSHWSVEDKVDDLPKILKGLGASEVYTKTMKV